MAGEYIAFSAAIVIDSLNDNFTVDIGGTAEQVSVTQGTYYLSGNPATNPTSIWAALKDAIETHSSSPTVTLGTPVTSIANGTATQTYQMGFATSTALSLFFTGGSNNFPYLRLGLPSSFAATTSFSTNIDPQGFWVSDQPPENETKDIVTRDVTQNATMNGGNYTYQRGYIQGEYNFAFNFINPERTMIRLKNTLASVAKNRTFESFLFYATGNGMRVSKLTESTPGIVTGMDDENAILTSNEISNGVVTKFQDWIISADTKSAFTPARFSSGLELYAWDVSLKARRV
tara:strand:+ start:2185 stop:3051 length:867 start_codon:yes stop_codon:yes gene_type:complete